MDKIYIKLIWNINKTAEKANKIKLCNVLSMTTKFPITQRLSIANQTKSLVTFGNKASCGYKYH